MKKKIKMHMVGNAHLDPAWLWKWEEGYQETLSTCQAAVDRLKEYPEFVFIRGEAWVYKCVEDISPELFAEIKKYMRAGRWFAVNGWWVQSDGNIPCGEAFVRQALYGKKYFREKFGVDVNVGWCVDTFGQNAGLPQILKKSGYEYYVFKKPREIEKHLPASVFRWQGADGSEVLAFRVPSWAHGSYGIHIEDLGEHIRCNIDAVPEALEDGMCLFGVGNHGGGPTKKQIEYILKHRHFSDSCKLIFSHPQAYFDSIKRRRNALPVVRGELWYSSIGCYANHSGLKKLNRQCEHLLIAAERWATVAATLLNLKKGGTEIEDCWKLILLNQFHDIITCTCKEDVANDALEAYGQARQTARGITNKYIRLFAKNIDTRGPGIPFVVFNFSCWDRDEAVAIMPYLGIKWPEDHEILDEEGGPVESQIIPLDMALNGKRWLFKASVPALGYRVYRVVDRKEFSLSGRGGQPCPTERDGMHALLPARIAARNASGGGKALPAGQGCPALPKDESANMKLSVKKYSLENEFWRLHIDPATGWIDSLYDKTNKLETIAGAANVPVAIEDKSDTWAHHVNGYRGTKEKIKAESITLKEKGNLRSIINTRSSYKTSLVSTDVILYAGLDLIEFNVLVDWREKNTVLKLGFGAKVTDPCAVYQAPYGHIIRPCDGNEYPGQSWADLRGSVRLKGRATLYGLAVINDAKYSYSAEGNNLYVTVLRSPPYAYYEPFEIKDADYPFMDQGKQSFRFFLKPHLASAAANYDLTRLAEEVNMPLLVTPESVHDGKYPALHGFIEVTASTTSADIIKFAEHGKALIVRLHETCGKSDQAGVDLKFAGKSCKVKMAPNEIKTLRFDLSGRNSVSKTNLIEK